MSISKYLIRNIHFQEDCDLVAIMDMSSYQFVNTLAQCYEANAQLQGGAVPGGESSNIIYPNQNVIVFFVFFSRRRAGGWDWLLWDAVPELLQPRHPGLLHPRRPWPGLSGRPGGLSWGHDGPGPGPAPRRTRNQFRYYLNIFKAIFASLSLQSTATHPQAAQPPAWCQAPPPHQRYVFLSHIYYPFFLFPSDPAPVSRRHPRPPHSSQCPVQVSRLQRGQSTGTCVYIIKLIRHFLSFKILFDISCTILTSALSGPEHHQ